MKAVNRVTMIAAPTGPAAPIRTRSQKLPRDYRRIPLANLIEDIVKCDAIALEELLVRPGVFRLKRKPLNLLELLDALGSFVSPATAAAGNGDAVQMARDLMVDRYAVLRGPSTSSEDGGDCRRYYQRLLNHLHRWLEANGPLTPLEVEPALAQLLQRQIQCDYRWCYQEARRSWNPVRRRYSWRVDKKVFHVWMPRRFTGRQCRAWLESNAGPVDAGNPDEKRRIQDLVDRRLGIPMHVPLDYVLPESMGHADSRWMDPAWVAERVSVVGLAQAVAAEKSDRIADMRPSLQVLGKTALYRLVIAIFKDIDADDYQEKRIAERFGISRSTLSRFAASRWQGDVKHGLPALFSNTASVLAAHPGFREAAEEAGVWPVVEQVLEKTDPGYRRRLSHGQ